MKKASLSWLCLLFIVAAFAQTPLSASRQRSAFTYIYRISPKETQTLYLSDMQKFAEPYLHTLVDSFPATGEPSESLSPGNYLLVKADKNILTGELYTVDNLHIQLLHNNRDLLISLHTNQGALINDATVYAGNKKMPWDTELQLFRLEKRKRAAIVKVRHHNILHFYKVNKSYPLSFWNKLALSFPLKYVIQPVKRWINGAGRYRRSNNYYYGSTIHEKNYAGYLVFNKPAYKPGDTVKLKAWVACRKSARSCKQPLLLRLTDYNLKTDTLLATLKPYRAGGYEYSFVLQDSLHLQLDEEHTITLEEVTTHKAAAGSKTDNYAKREEVAKRPVVMRGRFHYEEYELKSVSFNARTDKSDHNRGTQVSLYCKATDENDLPVMDGRVEITIMPESYGQKQFNAPQVFLPDTLWHFHRDLESIGETRINIPDSIFPEASFKYQVICNFLNSNNESRTVTLHQSFQSAKRQFLFDQQRDSLHISLMEAGQSKQVTGTLIGFNDNDDTVFQKSLQLPATVLANPCVAYYEIEAGDDWEDFHPDKDARIISCQSLRTADSVIMLVDNPQHLPFRYSIFAGNRIIQNGYTNSLCFKEKVRTPKNYFISLQYVYAGIPHEDNYTVPFKDKLLNIQVNQPREIYPGQQVKVDIAVTDQQGKPVADADLTAWAYTKKFPNGGAPFIPYFGKVYKNRKSYNRFIMDDEEPDNGSVRLNWERFSREMRLDTIEYYRFLHPQTLNVNTEPARDSITQLAPFVVIRGDLQPVHMLYIDEVPFFFSMADHLQQYSFPVSPGKHAIRIRTHNKLIQLDSIWAAKGMKTFIAINADTANKSISIQKAPDTLTRYEKALWSKYMILVENNFGRRLAVVEQQNRLTLLNMTRYQKLIDASQILTGPFLPREAALEVKDRFTQSFVSEGNYLFNINKGLIKQKQLSVGRYAFSQRLAHNTPDYSFRDLVFNATAVDSLWQDYLDHRNADEDLFRNELLRPRGNGNLQIGNVLDMAGKTFFVTNIFLFRYDDPDFVRIYKGSSRELGYIEPGFYRLFYLLKGGQYHMVDSILIKPSGITWFAPGKIIPGQKDSVSLKMSAVLNNWESGWRTTHEDEGMKVLKQTFNERYFKADLFSRYITGIVTDHKTGDPLPGAIITVKGTSAGVVTDAKGNFTLSVPERAMLEVNYIGYSSKDVRVTNEDSYSIRLMPAESNLQEVVVVGYGLARKSSLTGSVASFDQSLQGRVAGMNVSIRGLSSLEADLQPLYIVDGVPMTGPPNFDKDEIENMSVLKNAQATAIYGARAANGAIIITTKKSAGRPAIKEEQVENLLAASNSLRRNFNDYAFWQPTLRTDQQGKASFNTTFPDDITSWRTFYTAMSGRRSGFSEQSVRSFKSLTASLAIPQFAIEGDAIQVLAKTLHYGVDSILVRRDFHMDEQSPFSGSIGLRNAHIDSFGITVPAKDSVKFTYTIRKEDGYFDGEERTIPVFKKGVQETKGFFAALEEDTSFIFQPDTSLGNITIHAESNIWPVLLDEIESLRRYEYLCNEQAASKLKALLLKKKIYDWQKKDFKDDKQIRELIGRLNQNRSEGILWGWWKNNTVSMWISLQAVEALINAEQQGFVTGLNKHMVTDYLVAGFNLFGYRDKLTAIRLWKQLDAKVDYRKYIEETQAALYPKPTLYDKLLLLEAKQREEMPVILDTFLTKQFRTAMGNTYWGEENNRIRDNSVQTTLLMYRILKRAGHQENLLKRIRYYFLEKRKDGQWRNTYESSLILETILPDLMKTDAANQPAAFSLAGTQAATTISKFPYTASFSNREKITITGQKGMPVYFTAYQQGWNDNPLPVQGSFTVKTAFERNGDSIASLKGGENVTLNIQVKVKTDADYVMIEVPIPAGCSYQDKSPAYRNNEVHREYFKNKVSIFCSTLTAGDYTFSISLMPRYSGLYTLNPAKAEMMYFPVFYGREELKQVLIK